MASRSLRIGLLPGDGIGREIIPAGRRVLEALSASFKLEFSFVDLPAGFETFQQIGTALPDRMIKALKKECDGALFRAVSSPTTRVTGYSSSIVALQKRLDLFANIRPVKMMSSSLTPIDLVIVHENIENLYMKEKRTFKALNSSDKIAEAIKRISEQASYHIVIIAEEIVLQR